MYLIILILQEHYEGDIKGEDLKTLDNALELDLLEFALDHEEEDLEDEDELEEWKPSITNNPNKLPMLVPIKKIEKPRQCDKVNLNFSYSIRNQFVFEWLIGGKIKGQDLNFRLYFKNRKAKQLT